MSRPIDPNTQYKVKLHVNNVYSYASTQPPYTDPETGKKKYRRIHWGSVDKNLKFTPSSRFFLASPEERAKLMFPEKWDMSEAERLVEQNKKEVPISTGKYQNRLYGDVWFLEQVAMKTGILQDLNTVFNGNAAIVGDILTLAMFPYLTNYTYNRVARWQRISKTPSYRELTSSVITRFTQSITEQHRMDLLKLRAARLGKDELCAVDSTSRSAYGDSLADIRWGKNKDNLPLAQTTEVVVYTLSSHMPVYYRTFPGNIPDSRTLGVILTDLEHAGFKDVILTTDRGYESLKNLEEYILRGQSMITCASVSRKEIAETIRELGEFGARPEGMTVDPEAMIYHKQYDIDYEVVGIGQPTTSSDRLKLNLYFDPVRRSLELLELDIALSLQESALNELLENKGILGSDATIKHDYCYYKISYDPATRAINSYELNEKKVSKARSLSGFFSMITHGLDFDAMETFHSYCLRDEQEKYFQQMKSQMVTDRQRNWSEEGKTGRLFILFVSLIISSYVRYVWKSTRLRELFSSSLDILDEMRSIRLVEGTEKGNVITPFVGKQVDICEAFGFDIPVGCAPKHPSQQNPKRKRGRPPKKSV